MLERAIKWAVPSSVVKVPGSRLNGTRLGRNLEGGNGTENSQRWRGLGHETSLWGAEEVRADARELELPAARAAKRR